MARLKVKSLGDTVERWVTETPRRADYYAKYTPAAAEDWEKNTVAAAPIYKAAVQAADIDKRFAGGVKRVGAAKFRRKVESVGKARFGPGIEAARDDYNAGIAPFLEVLTKLDVPERKPRGDPANLKRVEVIAKALHEERLKRLAALVGAGAAS